VAAGHELSFKQEDILWRGQAIECRIYAEDSQNNFFPSPGTITHLQEPSGPGVRIDSGVRLHSEVSIHYDPMIAKLAVWGRTREEAIDRLRRALDEYEVAGITTTLPFFREIVRDDEFIAARLDTAFIIRFNERRAAALPAQSQTADSDIALIAAALHYVKLSRRTSLQNVAQASNRWKMSGRQSLLNARPGTAQRTKTSSTRKRK
jgi:acetyl-CoA carboxylase biotin carboxylase subunit